ncbi:MAG TPA: response regulator [Caulobacterales bacterium]|nr:response regulator [Caulobacterales bacterium]
MDSATRFNLESSSILLLEQSPQALEVLVQIFFGLGARNCHKCTSMDEAMNVARKTTLDLVVVDPNLAEGDGHAFVENLRRSNLEPNRSIPIIVISANGARSAVERARDVGASYFIVKPVTALVLIDRILRIARDERCFVVTDTYAGPDRRFKFEGPPPGIAPRRSTDVKTRLEDVSAPNMSQDEIDSLLKPQRVAL